MDRRVVVDGGFEIAVDPAIALELFTPEGERRWVPGWAPVYPDGRPTSPVPGTVFVTMDGEVTTTWVIVDRTPHTMRYARVACERTAGTVQVWCHPGSRPATTAVRVRYELTALSHDGTGDLRSLAADGGSFLEAWREAIEARAAR